MNYTDGELDFRDQKLGETTKLHLAVKQLEGRQFLDARKWIKYPTKDDFISSRKGLMISLEDWKRAIPLIQELIEANSPKV